MGLWWRCRRGGSLNGPSSVSAVSAVAIRRPPGGGCVVQWAERAHNAIPLLSSNLGEGTQLAQVKGPRVDVPCRTLTLLVLSASTGIP